LVSYLVSEDAEEITKGCNQLKLIKGIEKSYNFFRHTNLLQAVITFLCNLTSIPNYELKVNFKE
jgi:hypothetical protein